MAEEPQESPAASGSETSVQERPAAEDAAAWAGHRLDEVGGAGVGKVEGAYMDEGTGRLEWIMARMGRFGHYCLIPARDAVAGVGHGWVPYSRDQIRGAPRTESKADLTKASELALLTHYGVGGDAGRAAELAGRDDDAVTARPA